MGHFLTSNTTNKHSFPSVCSSHLKLQPVTQQSFEKSSEEGEAFVSVI